MRTSLTNIDLLLMAASQQMVLEAVMCETRPKGFRLRLMGMDAFLPETEVADGNVFRYGDMVNVCVVRVNVGRMSVIVSNRKAARVQRRNDVVQAINAFRVGEVYCGLVMEFAGGGVIISVGGILGIVPFRMLSWKYYKHPSEILSLGQEIMVVLKSKQERSGKVRLIFSAKDMEKTPWTDELYRYLDKVVEGEVVLLRNFGAFVDFDNVRGLIHKSDISWNREIDVRDYLYKGQKVRAKVLSVDVGRRTVGLSLKALTENPWDKFHIDNFLGEIKRVQVVRRGGGGLTVITDDGIVGNIPEEECGWVGVPTFVKEISLGEQLMAKVVSVDIENQRFAFSVRAMREAPWLELTKACSHKTELQSKIISKSVEQLLLEVKTGVFASLGAGDLPLPISNYQVGDFQAVKVSRIFWEKPIKIKVVVAENWTRARVCLGVKR